MINIVTELVSNKAKFPSILSPLRKEIINTDVTFTGGSKVLGEKYDPLAFYYPMRKLARRNEYGIPYIY
jgi:hypothetical protein